MVAQPAGLVFRASRGIALLLLGLTAAPAAGAPRETSPPRRPEARLESLAIHPGSILLDGSRSEQALLATGRAADGSLRDVTAQAKWTLARSGVAALDADSQTLRPVRDGETTLTAALDGKTARVTVRVTGVGTPGPVSFINDVVPVLTRAGCNEASCHGAQSGKGGLKLSLFGYDPSADYQALLGNEKSPRIARGAPETSVLLKKATAAVPHAGGKRFAAGSLPHRILRDWIAGGAPVPSAASPLTRLEVTPGERTFQTPGSPQRLLVRAFYAGGAERDVTSLARYDAQDPHAVEVTDDGTVTPTARGATAVMVRFGGQVAVFRLQVPFAAPLTASSYPAPANPIDARVFARLGELGLPLSGPATDLEFLRRVSLDLTGSLPDPDTVRAFSADRDPQRRVKLIESLLKKDEHVYFWTQKWCDLLKVNSRDLGQEGMLAYYAFLLESVRTNKPWDRLARELILSNPGRGPEGSYYRTARSAEERATSTAEVFLGVRIQCAQCHQHPFETWSQDDFWQFAAFFAKVPSPVPPRRVIGRLPRSLKPPAAAVTEVINPRTKQPALPPKPLGAPPISDSEMTAERREPLARWLASPENPWFARAFVNRVWKHFFGRGIVDPVDDLRVTNPPSNPELLETLAGEFVRSGCDARALMRMICNSRVYQTSSRPVPGNKEDSRFFSHAYFRRLTAEQLADAIAHATGIQDEYPGYEPGLRAIQLPDPQIAAPFLDAFGRPGRTQACECERTNDPSIAQALRLITGPGLSNKATSGSGRIARLLFYTKKTPDEIWEDLYYWSLSRPPTGAERQAWKEHVAERVKAEPKNAAGVTQEALEDWFWALLNSKEFLFNH